MNKIVCPKCKVELVVTSEEQVLEVQKFCIEHGGHGYFLVSEPDKEDTEQVKGE